MNQSITVNSLLKFYSASDWYQHHIKSEDLIFEDMMHNIENEVLTFPTFQIIKHVINAAELPLEYILLLRKINDNIIRLYKVKQFDRYAIVKQVKTLLHEVARPISIIRLDIKSFYNTIDKNTILSKILDEDSLLSYESKFLLRKLLLDHEQLKGQKGLPFGLNISATLSEIYMRSFDKNIRMLDGVYYYARFVDDILIMTYNKKDIRNEIKKYLPQGLFLHASDEKNSFETLANIGSKCSFEYLGYKFSIKDKELTMSIAEQKVKKIKTRIVNSFLDFFRDKNFSLLEQRIKFLTGNYTIRHMKQRDINSAQVKKLKAGIFYNYQLIDKHDQLAELNLFIKKIILSKNGSFGKKISKKLSRVKKNTLLKYSFVEGFDSRITHNFDQRTLSQITNCWK
ncbi:MAG: antiviral reverse transcriptase Drt3a [Sulfuricurvum sp.]|nr:antiviral reverse transcriptase Drt3a [Sulfuricurvum sp.]MDP3023537.1 antiviral reverse transcriptase Drt3a [Sulfuricurvum sp.]